MVTARQACRDAVMASIMGTLLDAADLPMTVVPLPPAEASRCKRLKASTHREHDSVDQLVVAARPFESRERYARFLQVQYQFHGSLVGLYQDEQLNRQLPGLHGLSRFAAVQQDMQDLLLLQPPVPTRVRASPAQALGWLYCCEGSNLGAAFLFKWAQHLGLDGTCGARHLAAHPQGRALHWQAFVAGVDELSLTQQQEIEAIDGAIAAFDAYRSHLQNVFDAKH